jgi:hypothetical protein
VDGVTFVVDLAVLSVAKVDFNIMLTLVGLKRLLVRSRFFVKLSLAVGKVDINHCVVMTIPVEIHLILHEKRQVVVHEMFVVMIVLAPESMVLYCGSPSHIFVCLPFFEGLENPRVLKIPPLPSNVITGRRITHIGLIGYSIFVGVV